MLTNKTPTQEEQIMHTLYPAIQPYERHEIRVTAPHVLYVEETGNPQGIPVMILHPGPGADASIYLRRFFDPQTYRIILFDQRGCGRSTPHAEIKNNTTQDLLDDIDTIRTHLQLHRFAIFGGGWGALLALLYAQRYPQQISGLLLHRIFLGRKKDVTWFYQQGANLVYPDYWQDFITIVPDKNQHEIPEFYANCLQGDNELARMAAAKSWSLWQARCSSLQPNLNVIDQYSDPHFALGLATIESYYITHHYFIEDNQALDNTNKIRHIPTYLIHGRYDMVCPLSGAWELHQALPGSELIIVRDAGHSDREAGMIDALISVTKLFSGQHLDVC